MTVVAAVDCGTNSTRMLVTDGPRLIDRPMRITRLGKGVDASGRLSADSIERTAGVLREFRQLVEGYGVTAVRATATSAARDAVNRDEFFDAAHDALGWPIEMLTGDEEGRLAFAGATRGLDPADGPFLVVDIGGGSTEFIVGGDGVSGVLSVDMGCVRVTEKFLHHDPPLAEELSAALSVLRLHIDDVVREVPSVLGARALIGVAGTVTTMAAIDLGLETYDRDRIHGHVLTRQRAEAIFRMLATEPLEDRMENPGVEVARADVIVGGALVLVGVMRHFDLPACLVSESDILDALAASLL